MRIYETGIILDPQLEESNIDRHLEQVESIIKENGGKLLEVNRWGMRRLAYEIDNKQQGFYCFFVFEGEGTIPRKLEQAFVLNESIMRFITVRAESYKPKPSKAGADSDQGETGRSTDGYRRRED